MNADAARTRGRQAVFFGARRRARVIRLLASEGAWQGRRGPMRISMKLDPQQNLNHDQISFTVSIFRDRMTGSAGTVVEAIDKLEELFRDRTLQAAREKRSKRNDSVQSDNPSQ